MPKPVTSLCNLVVGVIAAAALSLPLSVAQADQQTDATVPLKKHAARMHHPKQSNRKFARGFMALRQTHRGGVLGHIGTSSRLANPRGRPATRITTDRGPA